MPRIDTLKIVYRGTRAVMFGESEEGAPQS